MAYRRRRSSRRSFRRTRGVRRGYTPRGRRRGTRRARRGSQTIRIVLDQPRQVGAGGVAIAPGVVQRAPKRARF